MGYTTGACAVETKCLIYTYCLVANLLGNVTNM